MLRTVLLLVISTSLISCSGDFQQFKRSFGQLIVFTKSHTAQAERRIPEGNKKYLVQIQAPALPPVPKVKEPTVSTTNKNTVVAVNKNSNKQSIGSKFKNLFKRSKPNPNATIKVNKDINNLDKISSSSQIQQPRPIKCLPAFAYKEKGINKKVLNKDTKHIKVEKNGKVNDKFPSVQSIPPRPVVFKNPKDMQTKISNDINAIKQEVKKKFPAKKGTVNNKKSNNKSNTSKVSTNSTAKSQNKKESSKPIVLPMSSQSTTPNSPVSVDTKSNVIAPVVSPSGNNTPSNNNKSFIPVATAPVTSNTIDKVDSKSKPQDSPALPVLLPPPLPSNVVDAIKNGNKNSDDPFLPASRYNKSNSSGSDK